MRRGIAALRTRCAGAGREDGNAMVEFIGAAVLLLLPVMYIGIALARLQAGVFATEAAAREIGRVVVTSADASERAALSDAALRLALDDQGFDPDGAEVAVTCATATCPAAGGEVTVRVVYPVELPFVPRFVGEAVPLSVPVEAVHVAPVGDHVVP
ncbi:hypothetical protein [Paraoerskovia marina]|uniref:hypothetical protein n=1 Tax=Paraoerskovia marina TaxID=545619 RepID=UPI0005BADA85|nr:hypothetical protein [Paraoerskovia marina]